MLETAIRPLDDRSAFLSGWAALYERCDSQKFFNSPAWMSAWLSGAPDDAALYMIEGMRGGALMLLGAFTVRRRQPPLLGLREVWFRETGSAAHDDVYVEYNDFLIAPDAPGETRNGAVCAMLDTNSGMDACVFRNTTPDMSHAVRACAIERRLAHRVLNEQPVFVCNLQKGDILAGLSKSLQTKIKRAMRLYEERGPLSVRTVAGGESEFEHVWRKLVALHGSRWGAQSVFDNQRLLSFHERLRESSPGALHLFEVKAGDETIAVLYNFAHGERVMNYQSGFMYESDNRLTPGFLAHVMAAQHYADAGYKIYDLLAGEADYKKRLGVRETVLTSLVIERPTWRNHLRNMMKR
ncbi:GNAT family N-acetyltransferase [Hyphococcus sp.]|uniref:GNAT family N-acetyltransferase n=1 Tax=Hyphococcus sp. TaxID=2038636 RepID=UPI003CCB9BC9